MSIGCPPPPPVPRRAVRHENDNASWSSLNILVPSQTALDSLGFGEYKDEAKAVVQEAKAVAAKKRRASTKLENLGIPEEELLRQQQELFAKVRK